MAQAPFVRTAAPPLKTGGPNGRVRGEDLIADLFEAMHDLHFLKDALEGGEFCLALAMEKLPSQVGIVHLYDIDHREFLITSTRGSGMGTLLLQRFPESDPILLSAMNKRKPLVFADAPQSEAAAVERYASVGGARSVIVAPVEQAGGASSGPSRSWNPLDGQPFTEAEGNAIMYIAEQLAEFLNQRGVVTDPEKILCAAGAGGVAGAGRGRSERKRGGRRGPARAARAVRRAPRRSRRRRDPHLLHVPHDAAGQERLRQQSVLEATLGLASEKAGPPSTKRIVEQDSVIFAITDPQRIGELSQRWLPTAQRETPTVRAVVVLDESRTVIAFASRAGGAFADEEAFRRLLVQHMIGDMDLGKQPPDELRHLHHEYRGQSFLFSYWQRVVPPAPGEDDSSTPRRYIVVAWHDIGRIVKDTMPALFAEGGSPARVNVVDEDGRIIFGPPRRSGEFTVGVRFPTTLYGWRVQVSPSASDELTARVRSRTMLEQVMVLLSCVVLVLGMATISLAAWRERRVSALKSEFVANVSHELKTPLALVRMFAEMLQSGRVASDAKKQEYLDIIVSESERLSALIENVLDFARVERGRQAYELAEGSVGDAVTQAVAVYRHRAEREGVELTVDVEPGLSLPPASTTGRSSSRSSTTSTTR